MYFNVNVQRERKMQCDNGKAVNKTLIGVLASQDDPKVNSRLISIFNHLFNITRDKYDDDNGFPFHFVFTGGTHDRVLYGDKNLNLSALNEDVARWLIESCGVTRLESTKEGGVIVLTYLICQRKCSIVWPFLAPNAHHWQRNENLALTRLSDQWHAKRLMNVGSVMTWYHAESKLDINRNLQQCPPQLKIEKHPGDTEFTKTYNKTDISRYEKVKIWREEKNIHDELEHCEKMFNDMTVALIAHDDMKKRMVEFAVDHESELDQFKTILATGTTGREVAAATSRKIGDKMVRHHSGPKGGDIEIATAILCNLCDIVIFFIDPLSPHPHIDDIRVVFQACMVSDKVVMITNEMHAREFMSRTVRGKDKLWLYSIKD